MNVGFIKLYKLPAHIVVCDTMQKLEHAGGHRIFGEHKTKWITISMDEYDSMRAALEMLSDPEAMASVRRGEKDIASGRFKKLEDLKKELGI